MGEPAEERDHGGHSSAPLQGQTEGSGLSTNSPSGKTLFEATRIGRRDMNLHLAQPSGLSGPRQELGGRQPLVTDHAEVLQFHQRSTPGNGLGGDSRRIPPPEIREAGERRFDGMKRVARRCGAAARPKAGPPQQPDRDETDRESRDGWIDPREDRGAWLAGHQLPFGYGTTNDIRNFTARFTSVSESPSAYSIWSSDISSTSIFRGRSR